MTNKTTKQTETARDSRAKADASKRFTLSWGWFLAPRFGAAASGGLEYEPLPASSRKAA